MCGNVLSTAMIEGKKHDLELQKLLSASKEGTCSNTARLKESQESYKGDNFITECVLHYKKNPLFCEKNGKPL